MGATLELADPETPAGHYEKFYHWRGSTEFGGSPGRSGIDIRSVIINEVLPNTDVPGGVTDSIELFNPTSVAVDIGGWYLSDSAADLLKYRIPSGTTIGPGAYLVFDEDDFNDPSSSDATDRSR